MGSQWEAGPNPGSCTWRSEAGSRVREQGEVILGTAAGVFTLTILSILLEIGETQWATQEPRTLMSTKSEVVK
jgi:hypothetical protein